MSAIVEIPSRSGYSIPAIIDSPSDNDCTGTVVMTHGIFSDRSENGRFDRQASIHVAEGWRSLRFDWQGHGAHPVGFDRSSIAGNVDDYDTVLSYCRQRWDGPLRVVASSFGGSVFLLHQMIRSRNLLESALLLNPITDYLDTFDGPIAGELAAPFSHEQWDRLWSTGTVQLLPGKLLSRPFAIELLTLRPYEGFRALTIPTLIVHGTDDASVSCSTTRSWAAISNAVTFETIDGADHAFDEPWEEEASFALIRAWFYGAAGSV